MGSCFGNIIYYSFLSGTMDNELRAILYPSNASSDATLPPNGSNPQQLASEERSRNFRKKLVIGTCLVSSAVIGGVLIPFVSPGFRKIALPYIPATDRQVNLVTSVLSRRPGTRMIDLGSGDGRLVIVAAQKGLLATGVERNWLLVLFSRWRSFRTGVWNEASFIRGDLYKCDFRTYDVIVLFGVSGMMESIKKKLASEMGSDSIFVACRFPLPVKPTEQLGAGTDSVWVYKKSDLAEK